MHPNINITSGKLTNSPLQIGLTAILGPSPSPSQIHDLTLRAQCFYLSRKKSIPIDFDGYKAYLTSKSFSTPNPAVESTSTSTQAETSPQSTASPSQISEMANAITPHHEPEVEQNTAPYPPTFAQIVALITSGQPIPRHQRDSRHPLDYCLRAQASETPQALGEGRSGGCHPGQSWRNIRRS
jgi:hypothetical protein